MRRWPSLLTTLCVWLHGSAANKERPRCSEAFTDAARTGDMAQLRLCLELEEPRCVDETFGRTPLHFAAEAGQPEAALELIAAGALMDEDYWGRTPLHSAVMVGKVAMIELLLNAGAYIEVLDHARRTSLHHAARLGYTAVVKLLLDRGAAIDPLDSDYRAPLHMSSRGDEFLNVSRLLVERGSNIEGEDVIGFRPLHVACSQNQLLTVQYFIQRGANLYALDRTGWNPLVHAAAKQHIDVVDWLVVETLRPETFPAPDPEGFLRYDINKTVFFGLPAWTAALVLVGVLSVLLVSPALCCLQRQGRRQKAYEVTSTDTEIEAFVESIFGRLEQNKAEQSTLIQEWDRVPSHTLQDLHRVKTSRYE